MGAIGNYRQNRQIRRMVCKIKDLGLGDFTLLGKRVGARLNFHHVRQIKYPLCIVAQIREICGQHWKWLRKSNNATLTLIISKSQMTE